MSGGTLGFVALVAVLPFVASTDGITDFTINKAVYTFDILCTLDLADVTASANISYTDAPMTAAPVATALNLTVLQEVAGHVYEVVSYSTQVTSSSGVLLSPSTASVSFGVPAMQGATKDRMDEGQFAHALVNHSAVVTSVRGLLAVSIPTSDGSRPFHLPFATASFPGLGWQPTHSPATVASVSISQDLDSQTVLVDAVVDITNTNPNVGAVFAGACADMSLASHHVGEGVACISTALNAPPSGGGNATFSTQIPVLASSTSSDALAIASVFSGPSQAVQLAAVPVGEQPCYGTSGPALPPATTRDWFKFLIAEVEVRTAPLELGAAAGDMGFTLQNPIGADVEVTIRGLQVFDNASHPMLTLSAEDPAPLTLPAWGTASTSTPLATNISYVFPPSNSSYAALLALVQDAAPVYLPVQFSAEVRLFGAGEPAIVELSQTRVVRVLPRVTPQGGCTSSAQCAGSYCIPGLNVCSKAPFSGCNSTSISCGSGGVVVPLNGSTPTNPQCTCHCIAPCMTGPACTTVDSTSPTCTASYAQSFAQSLGDGCGASGLQFPGGVSTFGVGRAYKMPLSPELGGVGSQVFATEWPRQPPPVYAGHGVSPAVVLTPNASAQPQYEVHTVSSAKAYNAALFSQLTALEAGLATWQAVKLPDKTITSVATSMQGNTLLQLVSQTLGTVHVGRNPDDHPTYNQCVAQQLLAAEVLFTAGQAVVANALVSQFADMTGHFLVNEVALGGVATAMIPAPYDLVGNPPPGSDALEAAAMTASAVAMFNQVAGTSAPGGSMDARYKAEVEAANVNAFCGGGTAPNCLSDNAAWQAAVRVPGNEAVAQMRLAGFDAVLPVPQTAAALRSLADAQVTVAANVANCGTCVDASGQCAATDEACPCRATDVSPTAGHGAYGRLCAQCSATAGEGYAWYPLDAKKLCVNSVSVSGTGCGSCPFGSNVASTVVEEVDENGEAYMSRVDNDFLEENGVDPASPRALEAFQPSEDMLRGTSRPRARQLCWVCCISCHHSYNHCNMPSVAGFKVIADNTQCHHSQGGCFCSDSSGDDSWDIQLKVPAPSA